MSASSCCSGLSVVVGAPVVLVTTVVDDAGAVVDGGAGSDAAPASRPHAANVSSAHPAIANARDTTHRSFLLLLRLLTVASAVPRRVCLSTTGSETPDGRHVRRAPSNDPERLPTGPPRPTAVAAGWADR